MPLLTFDNIGKTFGSRTIFGGISVSVGPSEHVAVLGPNGSGKSTFLRVAAGLLRPSEGSVALFRPDGERVASEHHTRSIGYLAPYVQFYRGLSALENLEFLISLRSQVPDGRASEMLHRVGLSDRADDLVGSFSSGMVQRMRLAAALVHAPDVVLFDEPYSNLDLAGSELVSSIVDDIVAGGGAVLVATNRDDVAAWCSRTLRISDYTKVVAV